MKLQTLLRIAWMTILLGIVIQLLQFVLVIVLDKNSSVKLFIADFSSKLAWTYVICASIALAASITGNPVKTGLAGLISTPIALYIANILHKGILKQLALDTTEAGTFLIIPVLIKALEYAILGLVFVQLKKNYKSLYPFILTGLLTGVVFGACQIIYKLSASSASVSFSRLLPLAFNEMIIPVGCSIIIYASEIVSRRIKIQ